MKKQFLLVKLDNNSYSVRSVVDGETFHPKIGPTGEARALYLEQLNLFERINNTKGEFVIWDVGLGAAANPITILENSRALKTPLRIISFDKTTEPLEFALNHVSYLTYLKGWENILSRLITEKNVAFTSGEQPVKWEFIKGDFPALIREFAGKDRHQRPSSPNAILYDAYSPKTNPDMWTLELFKNLHSIIDPSTACSLATYSRSTMLRVTLLLAGFFVGIGKPTGEKEETTIAGNKPEIIPNLLDKRWLLRAKRSTSAHPLMNPVYIQKPLSGELFEQLLNHPQFANQPI